MIDAAMRVRVSNEIDRQPQHRPRAEREQAVRIRIADEVERRHRRDTRPNHDALVSEQQQRRPQQIGELAGGKQRAEGKPWRRLFGAKRKTEVP